MKFYLTALTILVAVLGAIALVVTDTNPSAPMSSSADDSSMKTLKIE